MTVLIALHGFEKVEDVQSIQRLIDDMFKTNFGRRESVVIIDLSESATYM